MKVWHSFLKEIKLASKSFYFYIEVGMSLLILFLFIFVIPENFSSQKVEYLYFDGPEFLVEETRSDILESEKDPDLDGKAEFVELEVNDKTITAELYVTNEKEIYFISELEDMIALAKNERNIGAIIAMDENFELNYTYYLQGYESQRVKNLLSVYHIELPEVLLEQMDALPVKSLEAGVDPLSDRDNVLPVVIAFNGSLMGMFIVAAYIFLDKAEGVIKAYAVTAASVWQYLLSKSLMLMTVGLGTSLLIVIPLLGLRINYFMFAAIFLTSNFFLTTLGMVLTSYYDDMIQSFGVFYALIIVLALPSIAYFMPSWQPTWVQYIPTHPMIQGFKEAMLTGGDLNYVLTASGILLAGGVVLFLFANYRFKKTLTI